MKIFLSYASEDRDLAERIHLALAGTGHRVFFDRRSLAPASDFYARIRAAVKASDIFVFLVGEHSVAHGSYALTELEFARAKWPHPKDRVLAVRVDNAPSEQIPPYLAAVTLLEPRGNIPAEVHDPVFHMAHRRHQRTVRGAIVLGMITMVGTVLVTVGSRVSLRALEPTLEWLPPNSCPKPGGPDWEYFEAEAAQLSGDATADSEHDGFSGSGFVSGYGHGRVGTATMFLVTVQSAGTYRADLCYANANRTPRRISLYVNAVKVRQLELPNGSRWNEWLIKSELVTLTSGQNSISYRKDTGDDAGVNLDFIRLRRE